MTRKTYRSAQGKVVDLGALQLQNEGVRAVGNMNVNARGDTIGSDNTVIDQRNRRVQRQYQKQTNVSDLPPSMSNRSVRQEQADIAELEEETFADDPALAEEETVVAPAKLEIPKGGLAAAIARSKEVKQELEKTARQRAQDQLKKI
jgi:hypothetical protein